MPNRLPTAGVPTPTVRKSPMAQASMKPVENAASKAKATPRPVAKTTPKPAVKVTPKPNPTAAFDKDYNARFRNGTYDSGDYTSQPTKKK